MNPVKLWSRAADALPWSMPARPGAKKQRSTPTTRRELLALRPLRNPELEWTEVEGRVVLTIHRATNWKTRLLGVFFPLPDERRVELDAMGTDVWRLIDGQMTLGQIAKTLAASYQLTPREAELSLQQFCKELGRRGYIGFWVERPQDAVAPPPKGKAKQKAARKS